MSKELSQKDIEYQKAILKKDRNDLLYQKYLFFLNKAESTIKGSYSRYIDLFIEYFKDKEIMDENLILYSKYLEETLPRSSVATAIYSARGFLKRLYLDKAFKEVQEDLRLNLTTSVKYEPQRDQDNLTVEKVKQIFAQTEDDKNYRDLTMFQIMFFLSLRISEVANLQRKNFIDNGNSYKIRIIQAKGNKDANLFLDKKLITNKYFKAFLKYAEDDDYLFNNNGDKMTTRALRHRFSKYFDDGVTHRVRHSSAQYLIDNGLNINQVKQILRHSNINTTTRYLQKKLNPDDVSKAFDHFSNMEVKVENVKPKKKKIKTIENKSNDSDEDFDEVYNRYKADQAVKQERQIASVLRRHGNNRRNSIKIDTFDDEMLKIKKEVKEEPKKRKRF